MCTDDLLVPFRGKKIPLYRTLLQMAFNSQDPQLEAGTNADLQGIRGPQRYVLQRGVTEMGKDKLELRNDRCPEPSRRMILRSALCR